MTTLPKVLLSWSSGKDSAWALHLLREKGEVQVIGLLTTVNEVFGRVAMHAVRVELLRAQADAVGLRLWQIPIPSPCSNEEYDRIMRQAMRHARREGVAAVAFGDLFLEDVRRYREDRMRDSGLGAMFPLWGVPTAELSRTMVAAGLKAASDVRGPEANPRGFCRPRLRRRSSR